MSTIDSNSQKKKKIAFVSDAVYPYNKGGKEKRLYDISTRLAKEGHDVTIYCMNWWGGETERIEEGVKLHAISPYFPLYAGERRSIKQGVLFGLHCLKLIKEDFDVLDVDHMPYFPLFSARIVAWIKGKELIGTWNEVWGKDYWVKYLGFGGYIAAFLERLTILMPDKIISISEITTNRLRDMGYRKEIETVPLSIDLEHIKDIKPSKHKSDIIFSGRLLEHKNVDVLLEAVAELAKEKPEIVCFITGDGPEMEKLQSLSKKLGIEKNVRFWGFVENHDEVLALMKSSRVFAFPSTREGFGLVVLEANACGLPVVTTDHPDNAARELINNENGFMGNIEEFKTLLSKTINERNKHQYEKLKITHTASAINFRTNYYENTAPNKKVS